MKCSKPTVPRHFLITIVALVIAMMQLVIERSQRQSAFVPDKQIFVASMGHRRPRSKIDHMEIHKDRVAGEHAMDQKRGQVEQMLSRMHGEPGPRPDIDIAVVQRMDMLIDERHMQKPMHPVKMKSRPDRQQYQSGNKQDRIGSQTDRRNVFVRHQPHNDALEHGQLHYAAAQRPKHIVMYLVRKIPELIAACGLAMIEFQRLALPLPHVEKPVEPSCDPDHQA